MLFDLGFGVNECSYCICRRWFDSDILNSSGTQDDLYTRTSAHTSNIDMLIWCKIGFDTYAIDKSHIHMQLR